MKELELRREKTRGWSVVGRASTEQEETAEVIVPDAQPDIWQVWDASTCLLLQRKEAREGQAALYGLLKVTILYQPEGMGGAEIMEVTLPFDAAPELPGLTRQSLLFVCPKVLGTEVRLLNPRKVLVRVAYQLDLTAFGLTEQGVPSRAEDPGPYGIRQKTGEWHSYETVHVQEKSFTYQDTLVLPGGHPDAARLLATRACPPRERRARCTVSATAHISPTISPMSKAWFLRQTGGLSFSTAAVTPGRMSSSGKRRRPSPASLFERWSVAFICLRRRMRKCMPWGRGWRRAG